MSIAHLTFIDIETVPDGQYEPKTESMQNLFRKKFAAALAISNIDEVWSGQASLHAEFARVVAISIGKWVEEEKKFYIRSIASRDESELLVNAEESIKRAGGTYLVAHNGLEFDFPFLMRRYIIHGLSMPAQIRAFGIKPWDLKLEDTMKMWSGSAWNYRCSLELLCEILQLPNPKKAIDGTSVAELYYGDDTEALRKIGGYCSGDVLACAQVYCKIKGLPIIEAVEYV